MQPGSAASNCIVYLMPKRYRASILFWISMQARDCASLASPIHTGGHACGSAAQYAIHESQADPNRESCKILHASDPSTSSFLFTRSCAYLLNAATVAQSPLGVRRQERDQQGRCPRRALRQWCPRRGSLGRSASRSSRSTRGRSRLTWRPQRR